MAKKGRVLWNYAPWRPSGPDGIFGKGTLHLTTQNDQLMSERHVLGYKPALRLKWRCACRKSNPDILVVQSTQDRTRRFCPEYRRRHWPSPWTKGLGTPDVPANPFRAGHGFRGYSGSQLLRPVRLLAPQYGPDRSPGHRGLLLPGFQRVGRPSRCWI